MSFRLCPYHAADFDAAMNLWVMTWEHTYPDIDFHGRLDWWKQRWLNELLPVGEVIVALDAEDKMAGFIVITPATGYLDQIVVSPKVQGRGLGKILLDYAKGRAEGEVTLNVNQSNEKALGFYLHQGFEIIGQDINERSNMPVYQLRFTKNG